MKVLIVEDDRDSREVLTVMLQIEGYEVVPVENGLQAWRAYRDGVFSLIVSDWLMPELDGVELCRLIRSLHRPNYAYIILLTALKGKNHFLEAMSAGADDFISKPFDPDEFKAKLHVAKRIVSLQDRVKTLEGILPTCMYCKKIRDERNVWVSIEHYISERSDAAFSHGVCPDCFPRLSEQLKSSPGQR